MDILLYLSELLQTRKTIGIVGLGTLYKKKLPGKYDVDKHAFVPPTYTISFTTDLKEQEELASYISSKRNISTDSANYYIGEFAEQIQAQLAENQEADLASIGKLKLVNNEIILITEQENNFGFEFYGLPTLTEITPEEESVKEELVIPETIAIKEIQEENKLEEENSGQETIEEEVVKEEIVIPETLETIAIEEIQEENKLEEENLGQETIEEESVKEEIVVPETLETIAIEEIQEENKLEEENPGQETTEEFEENILLNDEQETFEEIREADSKPLGVVENTFKKSNVIEIVELDEKEDLQIAIEGESRKEEYFDDDESKKGIPFSIKVLIIILSLIIAGAVAYFINPAFFNNYFKNPENEQESSVPAPVSDPAIAKAKADSLYADSLTKANAMVKLVVDTPKVVDSIKVTTYEVLVTAVATEKKANKTIAKLQKEGFKAKKIKLSKTMINISAGSFSSNQQALKLRDSLRIRFKDNGIYVQPIITKTHKK